MKKIAVAAAAVAVLMFSGIGAANAATPKVCERVDVEGMSAVNVKAHNGFSCKQSRFVAKKVIWAGTTGYVFRGRVAVSCQRRGYPEPRDGRVVCKQYDESGGYPPILVTWRAHWV